MTEGLFAVLPSLVVIILAWATKQIPIAIPLAAITGGSVIMAIGAVFAGGTFGDVTSPLSGMTVILLGQQKQNIWNMLKLKCPIM